MLKPSDATCGAGRHAQLSNIVFLITVASHAMQFELILFFNLCNSVALFLQARKQETIDFCGCDHDQVRLIQMGYIGGSPKYPRTAFSIRLLRFHHILWKRSAVAMLPFSKAVDEFLDAHNPLILTSSNNTDSEPTYHVSNRLSPPTKSNKPQELKFK